MKKELNPIISSTQHNNPKFNLEYEGWLQKNNPQPNQLELDDMHRVFCKSSILKNPHLTPVNNFHYQPLQGA